jgi:hypothetical protein
LVDLLRETPRAGAPGIVGARVHVSSHVLLVKSLELCVEQLEFSTKGIDVARVSVRHAAVQGSDVLSELVQYLAVGVRRVHELLLLSIAHVVMRE